MLALAVLSFGCGDDASETRSADPAATVSGGTAIVGVSAGATTLLPPLAAAALDFELGGALFLALNHAEWRDGRLEYLAAHPLALARSWTFGSDGASLVYALDTSYHWSDGRPIRAADVVFTYELLSDPELALPLSSATEHLDSVVAVTDSTVAFHFDRPYPGMLFDTGVGIIPLHVYGDVPRVELRGLPLHRDKGEGSLVVSGPFRLESWQPNDRIVLSRNSAGEVQSSLDRVVIRVLPEETTRLAELRGGGLDLAQVSSYRAATELETTDGIRVERIPQRGYDYIAWNPGAHPAFADAQVRRAFSLAIDRKEIIAALDMGEYAEPAHGPYGSLFARLAPPPPDEPGFNPAEARRTLENAGWRDEDGDGVREKGDVRLEFELATTAGNARRESAVQIIQSQLAAVGARAELRLEDFSALLGRVIDRQYESALLGWQVSLDPDISVFWGDPGSPFNVVGYADETARALIDSAQAQSSSDAAAPYWRRAAERIAADHPYAFLWFFDLPVAIGPRLRGVDVSVTGFAGSIYRWWIPRQAQIP